MYNKVIKASSLLSETLVRHKLDAGKSKAAQAKLLAHWCRDLNLHFDTG